MEELGDLLRANEVAVTEAGLGGFPLLEPLFGVETATFAQLRHFASFSLSDVRILLDPWARIRDGRDLQSDTIYDIVCSARAFPAPAAVPAGYGPAGSVFRGAAVSYWEIKDALHQLMVRTTAFHEQILSDCPDWQDLWQVHLELCRIERFLELKENE